jgi:hypothetical protein
MKHAFRAQNTPNADPKRLPDNTHIGASSVAEGMAAFRSRLPAKHRKDAVQAIEYLVTGSPELMQSKNRIQQDKYFQDAIDWLHAKHGAENVVYVGIHRDETTPHLFAYVVPRVGEKLNCRQFLGGAKALSDMQSDFADSVGAKHGLARGIKGSKARHTTLKQHYAALNAELVNPISAEAVLPRVRKPGVLGIGRELETGAEVSSRLHAHYEPALSAAKTARQAQQRAKSYQGTAIDLKTALQASEARAKTALTRANDAERLLSQLSPSVLAEAKLALDQDKQRKAEEEARWQEVVQAHLRLTGRSPGHYERAEREVNELQDRGGREWDKLMLEVARLRSRTTPIEAAPAPRSDFDSPSIG